jgi:hypothetical protein
MPSVSPKQEKFMRAVANSPQFAKKVGVSQSVGKEFKMMDKKMAKMAEGGTARKSFMEKMMNLNPNSMASRAFGKTAKEGAEISKETSDRVKNAGAIGAVAGAAGKAVGKAAKKGAEISKEARMARGGGVEHKGKTRGTMVKMAAGGSVSKRADGIAQKGKTNCKVM